MKKKQIDEKEFLANATHWFEKTHETSPEERNLKFTKVWHKPTMFGKTPCVVFAPTEEISKAYIWEQNVILRAMKNFVFLVIFCIATIFTLFSQIHHPERLSTIGGIIIGVLVCGLLFFLYLGRKCKKCEKIHQWNVEIYHSGL